MDFADNRAGQRSDLGGHEQARGEGGSDEVFAILEAASDLGDRETVEACHRVIEANKAGAAVSPTDMRLILNYFR